MQISISNKYAKIKYGKETFIHPLNTISYIINDESDAVTFFRNNESIGSCDINKLVVNGEQVNSENMEKLLSALFNMEDIQNKLDYSFEEKFTGQKWVDGKKIYKKTIHMETLPNNKGNILYPHGISNIESIVESKIFMNEISTDSFMPMNYIYGSNANFKCSASVTKAGISVSNNFDGSGYIGYATIYYTCTDK